MSMLKEESSFKCFGGIQKVFTCQSEKLKNEKRFCVYLPPKAILGQPCPVLYWLMGATCDDQEFIMNSGMQKYASAKDMIVISVTPVPVPLNLKVDPTDAYNLSRFGFFTDCDQPPFNEHYHMHSFLIKELVPLIDANFPIILNKRGISGHSLGGHGSLVFGLTHPDIFLSISTMSALCNPTSIPVGKKIFEMYFGSDQEKWKAYDATCLLQNYKGPHRSILFDMVDDHFD